MSVVTRITTSEELTVPFTPEEVWEVLAAASAYPDWWPVQWPARLLSDQPGLLGSEIEVRPFFGGMFRFRFEELHEPFAMRLRFFGGRFEGPGGFLLRPGEEGRTRIRYDIDVFARGMGTAAISQVFPLDAAQRFHMRSVLRNLEKQVRGKRKAAEARLRADAAAAARLATEVEARRLAAELEARRIAEVEAMRLAAEEAERRRAAEQARVAAEAEVARIAAETAARLAAEEEARRLAAELEARRIAEVEALRLAAEEAERRRAAEQARVAAEAEVARIAAETAARLAAEEEARRLAAELEARRIAEVEAMRLAAEEAERRRAAEQARVAAEAEVARIAAETAARLAAEEEARRLAAELEARRIAEVEAMRLAAEEAERRRAAEQARVAAEAEVARIAAETAARLAAEEEARRLAMEEAAKRAAQETESRRLAEEVRAAEAARVATEVAARLAAEEEARRLAVELEARRIAEVEAMRLAAEEAQRRRAAERARVAAEAEVARIAAETAARLAAEAEMRRLAMEETAKWVAQEAESRRLATELEARRIAEVEALRLAAEEAERRRAAEEAAEETRHREEEAPARVQPARSGISWLHRIQGWFLTPEAIVPEAPDAAESDSNFALARKYLAALSSSSATKTLDEFLAKELVRVEYPHRFLDRATSSHSEGTFGSRAREAGTFEAEAFELKGATGGGSQVAMEIAWSGRVRQHAPPLVKGQELDARLAVFLKFHRGRVVREHVYACFEPWSSPSERARVLAERSQAEAVVPKAGDSGPGSSQSNFEIARNYLAAMNAGAGPEEVAGFFAEDGIQEEFSDTSVPAGVLRTRAEIERARARDLALLTSEYYELRGAFGGGSQVAMEIAWTGVVGATTGSYTAGQKLEGHLAVFLKLRDGLIVRQRSYRCLPRDC